MEKLKVPLFITIPHSGEKVPSQTPWLQNLPEEILMCDVDRYVDILYTPAIECLHLPMVKTDWHRYAVDLNRIPSDIDASSVEGNDNAAGMHSRGFHWVHTTLKQPLMKNPMNRATHDELVKLIYDPFHAEIKNVYGQLHALGFKETYQLDVHSMPSVGTYEHRDPGQQRAEIVISDCGGKSSHPKFRDLVIASYVTAGFKVGYNWPYLGGRVTEHYGVPKRGQNALQVEMNRAIYMDEKTKKLSSASLTQVQDKLTKALNSIFVGLPELTRGDNH